MGLKLLLLLLVGHGRRRLQSRGRLLVLAVGPGVVGLLLLLLLLLRWEGHFLLVIDPVLPAGVPALVVIAFGRQEGRAVHAFF